MHAGGSRSRLPKSSRVLFQRELDEHQTGFAFGEVLAHVNHMLNGDQLVLETDRDDIDRYRAC